MFENIGGKIKALAKVVCWVGIAASAVWAIVILVSGIGNNQVGVGIGGGLLALVLGGLLSWIGAFFTYGFGDLVSNVAEIRKELDAVKAQQNK